MSNLRTDPYIDRGVSFIAPLEVMGHSLGTYPLRRVGVSENMVFELENCDFFFAGKVFFKYMYRKGTAVRRQ